MQDGNSIASSRSSSGSALDKEEEEARENWQQQRLQGNGYDTPPPPSPAAGNDWYGRLQDKDQICGTVDDEGPPRTSGDAWRQHMRSRRKERKQRRLQLWEHLKALGNEPVELTKATTRTFMKCFRRPRLREKVSENNTVNEVFYDIVFAMALGTARNELVSSYLSCPEDAYCNRPLEFALFVLLFAQFWFHAFQLVLFSNRFTTEEFSYNLALYGHMAAIVIMAVNGSNCVPTEDGRDEICSSVFDVTSRYTHVFRVFAFGSIISQVLSGMQFLRASFIPEAKYWCYVYGVGNLLNALLWLLGMAVAHTEVAQCTVATLSFVIYALTEIIAKHGSIYLPTLLPAHYAVRTRKFASVMLTQVLSGIIQPRFSYHMEVWKFIAGVLLMGFLFKILYFDFEQGSPVTGFTGNEHITEVLWTFANFSLGCSFTSVGACIAAVLLRANIAASPTAKDISVTRLRWTLCLSVCFASLSSCAIQLSLRGLGTNVRRWRKQNRLTLRALTGLCTLLIPLIIPDSWEATGIVWPLCLILTTQVMLDMYGRQRVGDSSETSSSVPAPASGVSPKTSMSSRLLNETPYSDSDSE
eukprot:gb/GECG01012231.1/.p1 GENE.gb/GECG01012231.1/~~gb/GECG01012231.1/.p1  ORF type:complete len:584 (+),score=45.32 gb/GECG01012231.1/:1-1752(+)